MEIADLLNWPIVTVSGEFKLTREIDIELKILNEKIGTLYEVPHPATSGSAGFDLRAMVENEIIIHPGFAELVPSGIAISIKDPNYCMLIIPRSGAGHNLGIVLGNGTGLIDSDYQGEIKLSLFNRGINAVKIHPGDRIAQGFITPIIRPNFNIVTEFSSATLRGEGGFGHTGNK